MAARYTVETAAIGAVETTAMGPVETTAMSPVETTAMGPVETTAMGPVETTVMGPVETTAMGPVETVVENTVETIATESVETEAPLKQRLEDLKCHVPAENTAPENQSSVAQTLPEVPLQIIFEYLCLEDLTNVQFVCTHWCKIAQNETLWKNRTWTLKNSERENLKYKQQLENMPMLQNVVIPPIESGIFHKKYMGQNCQVIETLLLYQKGLRSLEAYSLQSFLIVLLIRKLSNLQSICVSLYKKDALMILNALVLCKHLKHFEFKHSEENVVACVSMTDMNIITDLLSNSFTSLKSLDLAYFQEFLPHENIMNILKTKINQLEKLKLNYTGIADDEFLRVISHSRIVEVDLNIISVIPNWHVLKAIKSLKITISDITVDQLFLDALVGTCCMPNVENISIGFSADHDVQSIQVFTRIFPSLKFLKLDCVIPSALNNELIYLKNLPLLNKVSLSCAFNLETAGFLHLSKCLALESLEVGRCDLNDNSVQALSQCSTLRHLTLNSVSFLNIEQILSVIRSLHNLQTLMLKQCDTRLHCMSPKSITAIKSQCENQNISYKISGTFLKWKSLIK